MYEGLLAETVHFPGHNGDQIEAYFARPLGVARTAGVVVIHHRPGWDEWTKEVVRKLAHHGYSAVAPHLYSRFGPGTPDDLAAASRAAGPVPDDQVVGDVEGSLRYLQALPYYSGRAGAIGFCSGGRHTYLCACRIPSLNAAVDCWGGSVVTGPESLSPAQPVQVLDLTKHMGCPILGIFGNDDQNPSPKDVNRTEEELKRLGKSYEFHRYDGAGHGFFATERPGYRPEQAVDGWGKVFDFYARHLSS